MVVWYGVIIIFFGVVGVDDMFNVLIFFYFYVEFWFWYFDVVYVLCINVFVKIKLIYLGVYLGGLI